MFVCFFLFFFNDGNGWGRWADVFIFTPARHQLLSSFIIHQLIRARKLIIVGLYSVFLASIYSEGKCSSVRKVLERDGKDVYRSG